MMRAAEMNLESCQEDAQQVRRRGQKRMLLKCTTTYVEMSAVIQTKESLDGSLEDRATVSTIVFFVFFVQNSTTSTK